jgi:hypothetical protein
MPDETKQLELYKGEFAVLGPEAAEYLDILEENTGSRQIAAGSIPVWRFPGSGGDEWVFEDSTGNRQKTQALTGVVLGQRRERTFFRDKFSGGGAPPDCKSNDGITGTPLTDDQDQPVDFLYGPNNEEVHYGGACATCPLSAWESRRLVDGSYTGDGQACTEYRFGIIQRPDQPTPEGFRLPPSALKSWQVFGEGISRAKTRLSLLVISMRLDLRPKASTADLIVESVAYIERGTRDDLAAIAPEVKRAPQLAAPVDDVVRVPVEEEDALPF